MEIPSRQIERVFGAKNEHIHRIGRQTGAQIDTDVTCDPCKVRIRGDRCSATMAKEMILTSTLEAIDEASDYLYFPRGAAGAILGPDGSWLSDLQQRSGDVRIDVEEMDSD